MKDEFIKHKVNLVDDGGCDELLTAIGAENILKYMMIKSKSELKTKECRIENQKTYLIKDPKNSNYKIGISKNVNQRLRNIRVSNPLVHLICSCDDNIEKGLHMLYENQAIEGEWYRLSDSDVDDIIEIMKHRKGFIKH